MEKVSSQPRRALYTVLIGEYEKLNELEVSDSSVQAICFTDDPQLVSCTWDLGLDSHERLEEQRLHYEEFSPSPLREQPLWTGIIARRPTSSVRKWSDSWAQHVLRYSRRDQLSVLTVIEIHKPNFKRVVIDSVSSDFHQWPIHNERKREKRFYSGTDLVQESEKLQKEILQLNNELRVVRDAYANSTSWKITRPLRAISLALKAIRGSNNLETMNSDG